MVNLKAEQHVAGLLKVQAKLNPVSMKNDCFSQVFGVCTHGNPYFYKNTVIAANNFRYRIFFLFLFIKFGTLDEKEQKVSLDSVHIHELQ